jgi:hypothetical protein
MLMYVVTYHIDLPCVARTCIFKSPHPCAVKSQDGSGQLKRKRIKVSSIISCDSKKIDNLLSLKGILSDV